MLPPYRVHEGGTSSREFLGRVRKSVIGCDVSFRSGERKERNRQSPLQPTKSVLSPLVTSHRCRWNEYDAARITRPTEKPKPRNTSAGIHITCRGESGEKCRASAACTTIRMRFQTIKAVQGRPIAIVMAAGIKCSRLKRSASVDRLRIEPTSATNAATPQQARISVCMTFHLMRQIHSSRGDSQYLPFLQGSDGPVLAAPAPAPSIVLNMPRPGWQVNSENRGFSKPTKYQNGLPTSSWNST